MLPLVFYDAPSKYPEKSWSPNTGKTRQERTFLQRLHPFNKDSRLVLTYKNLPFETVWLEFPEIAPKLKEIGASRTKFPGGQERYTVPVLHDPNTGALLADSWLIAIYLDKTYPERPVFPPGSQGLINAFEPALLALDKEAKLFNFLRASQVLSERSRAHLVSSVEEAFRIKYEDWSPEGPKQDAQWKIVEAVYSDAVKAWYDRCEGKWLMGDTFSYADIILVARLRCLSKIYTDDEWKKIAVLHDGRWEKLLSDVERECNVV